MLNSSGNPTRPPIAEVGSSAWSNRQRGGCRRKNSRIGLARMPAPTVRRSPTVTPSIWNVAIRVVTGVSPNMTIVSPTAARVSHAPRITVTVYGIESHGSRCCRSGRTVHSRLWSGFAGREGAAEPPLERRDPFRRAQRSSDRRRPLDPSRRRGIGRCGEKDSKIGDQRAQRRDRCQLVTLAREMRADARPWPVPGMARQPRDHWIERDVACRRQQVRLVHHHRAAATLEKMAGLAEPPVDCPGVAAVRFAKGLPQPIPVRRRHDQMDMIGRARTSIL